MTPMNRLILLLSRRAAAPASGDPSYSSVKLLLHCDGANDSTTFTDNSGTPKAPTVVGNSKISTAQSLFGGASGLFDGSGDYLDYASSTDFDLFAGDFTIEFAAYFSSSVANQTILQVGTSAVERANISIVSNLLILYTQTNAGGGNTRISAAAPSNNAWHQIALIKSGSTLTLTSDGVSVGTSTTTVWPSGSMKLDVGVGNGIDGGSTYYAGYIDELRITKGVARYTAPYTPATSAFPNA
jgi:hypothetical protein